MQPVSFWDVCQTLRTRWAFLGPLLAFNLVATIYGWMFYVEVGQFVPTDLTCAGTHAYCQPVWWWPLVSDSPNAVLLFFIAALAFRVWGKRSKVLDAFAFTLNTYVGLWTTMLFLGYAARMGTFDFASVLQGNANPMLFVTHWGMPLQALLLIPEMRKDTWSPVGVAAVLAVLAVFVAVDYWGPVLHPAPSLHPNDALLHQGSPVLMVLAASAWVALAHVLARPKHGP